MSSEVDTVLSWYAIHTNPKQEDRAANNLQAWGVETFVPKFLTCQPNPFTCEPAWVAKHMFPRYIFAKFEFSRLGHRVTYTRGIQSVVSFGNEPAVVDEAIIALIRSQIDSQSFVRMGDGLELGDEVTVQEGPLKGLTGIFKQEVGENERIMILLNAVSYQAQAVVNRCLVVKHSVSLGLGLL